MVLSTILVIHRPKGVPHAQSHYIAYTGYLNHSTRINSKLAIGSALRFNNKNNLSFCTYDLVFIGANNKPTVECINMSRGGCMSKILLASHFHLCGEPGYIVNHSDIDLKVSKVMNLP